mgnify:CR=1 FL=1
MERTKKLTGIELKKYLMNRFGLSESEASEKAGISRTVPLLAPCKDESENENPPRIYVGTYAKYVGGSTKGGWIDLDDFSDSEEFYEACRELHKDENDPELMFQCWSNIPSEMIGESYLSDSVFEWLEMDEGDREMLEAFQSIAYENSTLEQARDAHVGTCESFRDWCENWFFETNEVPEELVRYICIDTVVRELEHDFLPVRIDCETTYVFDRNR